MTTKQILTIDNTSAIKDDSAVVSVLKLESVIINIEEFNRIKETIPAGETYSIDFWNITPSFINLVSKGLLRMYLGWNNTFGTFSGKVAGMTTDVVITADVAGTWGNITLPVVSGNDIEQMIADWNLANPTNTVTFTSGNPEQIPTEAIELTGGTNYTRADTDPYIEDVLNFSLSGKVVPITLMNLSTTDTVDVDILIAQY